MAAIEAQLRAEVIQLRRSNSSLDRRVGQLHGLLGELEPLWLESPSDVQEQVQLAITQHTPRVGVAAAALSGAAKEDEPAPFADIQRLPGAAVAGAMPSPAREAGQWQGNSPAMLSGGRTEQRSPHGSSPLRGTPAKPVPQLSLGLSKLNTAAAMNPRLSTCSAASDPPLTHRMDEEDDDDLEQADEPAVGQVTASPEHFREMMGTLEAETFARQELEEQLKALRESAAAAASAPPQRSAEVAATLERALLDEERSRRQLLEAVAAATEEWEWHGLPTGEAATASWGVLAPPAPLWTLSAQSARTSKGQLSQPSSSRPRPNPGSQPGSSRAGLAGSRPGSSRPG